MTINELTLEVETWLGEIAQMADWKVEVESPFRLKTLVACDCHRKCLRIAEVMRVRPVYELRALLAKELPHLESPAVYHRTNGKLRRHPIPAAHLE